MKQLIIFCCFICCTNNLLAQKTLQLKIIDSITKESLPGANVRVNGTMSGVTDTGGNVTIVLAENKYSILITNVGYSNKLIDYQLIDNKKITILMLPAENNLEEVTLVASTRNNQSIESSPLKVEVLGKEEVGEEVGIRPGNIASILGDVSGVQIQQSSAVTGNSNIRIQGLQGRYTQLLRDGMPLYDGFSGGLGILTIPPLDLRQIELIKGSASTLYGGGAIGGLINLISKKPTFEQEADIVANYTSLTELNINTYLAKRYKKVGYTLFAGYTSQQAKDVNNDGLSDVPTTNSFLIHPKVFFFPSDKTIISVGYSGTFDDRKGGDMQVLDNKSNNLHQYFEQNKSQRHTGEYAIDHFMNGNSKLTIKGLVSNFDKKTLSNTFALNGGQLSYYNEISVYKPLGHGDLVAGVNIVGDKYMTHNADSALLQKFSNNTIGAFAQYSLHIKEKTTVEGGLRLDNHDKYGAFLLPRLAIFHRFSEHIGSRAGFGMGYKTPNPLSPQDVEYDPLTIAPAGNNVKSEMSYGYNIEGNYKKDWDKEHTLFINQAFFLTQVNNPIYFMNTSPQRVELVNFTKPLLTQGFDTYIKMTLKKWELYGGFTYTDTKNGLLANGKIPLTPQTRMAFVLVKEIEEDWRFGLEGSFVGKQYRYNGTETPSYTFLALMAQYKMGKHFYIVLNCENLLDYRMSNNESLYTGSITNPSFKPLWAPIDGRVVNLSLRWKM